MHAAGLHTEAAAGWPQQHARARSPAPRTHCSPKMRCTAPRGASSNTAGAAAGRRCERARCHRPHRRGPAGRTAACALARGTTLDLHARARARAVAQPTTQDEAAGGQKQLQRCADCRALLRHSRLPPSPPLSHASCPHHATTQHTPSRLGCLRRSRPARANTRTQTANLATHGTRRAAPHARARHVTPGTTPHVAATRARAHAATVVMLLVSSSATFSIWPRMLRSIWLLPYSTTKPAIRD